MGDLARALGSEVLVLDGGLGTFLEARGNDLTGVLWSARLLRDDPDEVRAAHEEFVGAGADVVLTCTYQLGFGGPVPDDEVRGLLRRGVSIARDAGARFVAASVGPYGALRADGSEYTGDYSLSVAELRRWHRARLEVLADAGADALAVETIPSLVEAEAVCAELDGLGVPAWLGMSGSSSALGPAELSAGFSLAAETTGVLAAGVNCCTPDRVLPALALLPPGLPGVAYPNSGERWDAVGRSWSGAADDAAFDGRAWVESGARLVGGCCRSTPADIAALARAVG